MEARSRKGPVTCRLLLRLVGFTGSRRGEETVGSKTIVGSRRAVVTVIAVVLFGCGETSSSDPLPSTGVEFIRASAGQLVRGAHNSPIVLRGVNFSNLHWADWPGAGKDIVNSNHHAEEDFYRVANMGMNVIRFCLNYRAFEQDDAPYEYLSEGFAWLDQNLDWAEAAGMYLILDMHTPQGGYQGGSDTGYALWNEPQNQQRLTALWQAIASRYAERTIIAGYDLLNEPTPPPGAADPWPVLATEIATTIRAVDPNHLLIVQPDHRGKVEFFQLNDDNSMVDYHNYEPFPFTHQNHSYSGAGPWASYPDPAIPLPPTEYLYSDATQNAGVTAESGYEQIAGEIYWVTEPRVVRAVPMIGCSGANDGTLIFDDFEILEHPPAQGPDPSAVKSLFRVDPEDYEFEWAIESYDPFIADYDFWSLGTEQDPQTQGASLAVVDDAHSGNHAFALQPGQGAASAYHEMLQVPLRQGYGYQIKGFAKGVGLSAANCSFNLEVSELATGQTWQGLQRSALELQVDQLRSFAQANQLPFNYGEYGVASPVQLWPKLGAVAYIGDMIEIASDKGINHQLWDYRTLYPNPWGDDHPGPDGLPDPERANQPLIDALTAAYSQ